MEKVNTKVFKDVYNETVDVIVTNRVTQGSHKVVQAGIGTVAMVQSETGDVFGKLVERGEKIEKDGLDQVRKLADQPKEGMNKLGDRFNKEIESVLARMNIPTRSDIQALNKKVTALTTKVDELNKAKA